MRLLDAAGAAETALWMATLSAAQRPERAETSSAQVRAVASLDSAA
jgi:hypothetical protein